MYDARPAAEFDSVITARLAGDKSNFSWTPASDDPVRSGADSEQIRWIAVISESAFTVGDHGVHTAFVEQVRGLEARGMRVRINNPGSCRGAALTIVHTPGPFARLCLSLAGTRGVAVAHVTPDTLVGSLVFERRWRPLSRRYLSRFYRSAPRVIAVSPLVRAELAALGISACAIHDIPNGIDVDRIRKARSRARVSAIRLAQSGRPLVLGVGQVQPRKGIERFMSVARHLTSYNFVWIGGRPFGPLTERGVARSQIPANVRFVGRVSDDELLAHYHAADVFLFPSKQENFGQVVVEAAAAGVPLVLSDLAVFRTNFADGAELARTPRDYVNAVASIIENDELRTSRRRAALELADRFDIRHSIDALLELTRNPAPASPALTVPEPRRAP